MRSQSYHQKKIKIKITIKSLGSSSYDHVTIFLLQALPSRSGFCLNLQFVRAGKIFQERVFITFFYHIRVSCRLLYFTKNNYNCRLRDVFSFALFNIRCLFGVRRCSEINLSPYIFSTVISKHFLSFSCAIWWSKEILGKTKRLFYSLRDHRNRQQDHWVNWRGRLWLENKLIFKVLRTFYLSDPAFLTYALCSW